MTRRRRFGVRAAAESSGWEREHRDSTRRLREMEDQARGLGYTRCAQGDVCAGDEVAFAASVFAGSFRSPRFVGYELVVGRVERDSYGEAKQQHTFTIRKPDGTIRLVRGRNLYRNLTLRKPWDDEEARKKVLEEKHVRGARARGVARARKDARGEDLWG